VEKMKAKKIAGFSPEIFFVIALIVDRLNETSG